MLNLPIKILKTIQLQTAQASVTFSGINTLVALWDAAKKVTSRHLVVIVNAASPDAVAQRDVWLRFNADAGANYNYEYLEGEAAVASAARLNAQNQVAVFPIPGTNYTNAFGGGTIVIPHAFNTVNHKAILSLGGAVEDEVEGVAGRWANVAAITSLTLLPSAGNFAAGSTFHLGVIDERYLLNQVLKPEILTNTGFEIGNPPTGWTLGGAGATWERSIEQVHGGTYSGKLTRNGFNCYAYQAYADFATYRGLRVTLGSWVYATVANRVRITISDGTGTSDSPYHSGVAGWEWLTVTRTIDPLAGQLHAQVRVVTGDTSAYFDDITLTFSDFRFSIPQGEGDLAIIGYARTNRIAIEDTIVMPINEDIVVGNYPSQELVGRGAAITASQPNFEVGIVSAANATTNAFGALALVISQYVKSNQPHWLSQSGYHELTGPTGEVRVMSGRRNNTEPINKIFLAGSNFDIFVAGSLFSLYRVPKRIIQRQELTTAQATVTFANIPQNFEALMLHVYTKTDRAAASDPVRFTINADAVAANYDTQKLDGTGAVITSARSAADQNWMLVSGSGGGVSLQRFDGGSLLFPAYNETDRHKHCIGHYGVSEDVVMLLSARWESLAAITSIAMTPVNGPNFLAGSVFELEGILRKEGLPPVEGSQWGV